MPNTAYTTLTVIVRDVNDNPPTFLLTPYFFEITEEETGYVVGRRRGGGKEGKERERITTGMYTIMILLVHYFLGYWEGFSY